MSEQNSMAPNAGQADPEEAAAQEAAALLASGTPFADELGDPGFERHQPEPEDQPEEYVPAPQDNQPQQPEGEKTVAGQKAAGKFLGKFDSPEALEQGYSELEHKLGAQGSELGSAKAQIRQLETQLAVQRELLAQREAAKQDEPAPDPLEKVRERKIERVKNAFGLTQEEAEAYVAEELADMQELTGSAVQPLQEKEQSRAKAAEREAFLRRADEYLRSEAGPDGNPIRPDWEEVITSPEFSQIVRQKPDSTESVYGLDYAYRMTKIIRAQKAASSKQEGEALRAEAQQLIESEKERVGAAAGTTVATPGRPGTSEMDPEIAAIYGSNRRPSNPMFGGSWE